MTGCATISRATISRTIGACASLGLGLFAQAPGAESAAPVLTSGEAALLQRVDAALSAGDEKAFFACFAANAPTHALDAWRLRWRALAPEGGTLRRRSVAIRADEGNGVRSLIVQAEYRDAAHADLPTCRYDERWILTRDEATENGAPLIRLCLDRDAGFDHRLLAGAGVWRCPPCAFQMRVPTGWVAAPSGALAGLCLDAATYYHPSLDLALDVCVQIVAAEADARHVLEGVLASLGARVSPEVRVLSWCPAQFAATERPACIDAAKVFVELDEQRAVDARVISFGRLAFLLTCYGPKSLLRAHAAELERALAGFELDATVAPDVLIARAKEHHGGGAMFDAAGHFVHSRFGIRVPINSGWRHELLAGERLSGAIAWDAETRSRVRITVLPPPRGFQRWSLLLADRCLERTAGDWLASARDSGWVTTPDRPPRRTLVGSGNSGVCGLCAVQRDDVFLIVQWEACSPACRSSIERLLDAVELR